MLLLYTIFFGISSHSLHNQANDKMRVNINLFYEVPRNHSNESTSLWMGFWMSYISIIYERDCCRFIQS